MLAKGKKFLERPPVPPRSWNKSAIFYFGQWKERRGSSILLKVWQESCWSWLKVRLTGRELPNKAEAGSGRSRIYLDQPACVPRTSRRSPLDVDRQRQRFPCLRASPTRQRSCLYRWQERLFLWGHEAAESRGRPESIYDSWSRSCGPTYWMAKSHRELWSKAAAASEQPEQLAGSRYTSASGRFTRAFPLWLILSL